MLAAFLQPYLLTALRANDKPPRFQLADRRFVLLRFRTRNITKTPHPGSWRFFAAKSRQLVGSFFCSSSRLDKGFLSLRGSFKCLDGLAIKLAVFHYPIGDLFSVT